MNSLKQITIYPIKSCAGIDLKQAEVENRGFHLDRRWMLVDESGAFLSQRKTPALGQFKIRVLKDQLQVTYPGSNPLVFEIDQTGGDKLETRIWKDTVISNRVSQAADEWFSNCLDTQVQLVHMDQNVQRPLQKDSLPSEKSFEVSFADGYPYLLTNQASLDDLNTRLVSPIGMDRFRTNMMVDGFPAFAEDKWKNIRIGRVEFMVVKPCARCQVTTIDQKTGKSSKEPLKTLATYRKQGGQVMFGMNLVALNSGRVELGDPVTILDTK